MENERELQAQQTSQEPEITLRHCAAPDFTILALFIQEQQQRDERKAGKRLRRPEIYQLLRLFESAAHKSYIGNPDADHRLTLVKLNVFSAFVSNITILGYTREWMTDDSLSRFSVSGPHPGLSQGDLPASLQPTSLQQTRPHHPWLDFFPFPKVRDILIAHEDDMDDVQLCRDLMGFYTMPSEEDNCILVWGDPWNPMNWEVTETFLRKWGWIVKGCPEIIWSTNHWRRIRGQRRIRWKNTVEMHS
ncbi:unnamed protein product [Penicillium olsonii]|uniref:Uncharacterized protein n=1 Tax=Penicillium olsonii TaxID=99116 RepID=A0A9W4ID34_PENOL|nr:unnamed protein product [Penicillium olsonii]CAG8257698.1 unnamed protein product [Penicillium olsonii]